MGNSSRRWEFGYWWYPHILYWINPIKATSIMTKTIRYGYKDLISPIYSRGLGPHLVGYWNPGGHTITHSISHKRFGHHIHHWSALITVRHGPQSHQQQVPDIFRPTQGGILSREPQQFIGAKGTFSSRTTTLGTPLYKTEAVLRATIHVNWPLLTTTTTLYTPHPPQRAPIPDDANQSSSATQDILLYEQNKGPQNHSVSHSRIETVTRRLWENARSVNFGHRSYLPPRVLTNSGTPPQHKRNRPSQPEDSQVKPKGHREANTYHTNHNPTWTISRTDIPQHQGRSNPLTH